MHLPIIAIQFKLIKKINLIRRDSELELPILYQNRLFFFIANSKKMLVSDLVKKII